MAALLKFLLNRGFEKSLFVFAQFVREHCLLQQRVDAVFPSFFVHVRAALAFFAAVAVLARFSLKDVLAYDDMCPVFF